MIVNGPAVRSVQIELAHTGAEGQRAAITALLSHWRGRGWPPDLLALACLTSVDGAAVATYSQWSAEVPARSLWGPEGPPGHSAGVHRYRRVDGVSNPGPAPEFFTLTPFPHLGAATEWLEALPFAPGLACGHLHLRADGRLLGVSGWALPSAGGFRVHTSITTPVLT